MQDQPEQKPSQEADEPQVPPTGPKTDSAVEPEDDYDLDLPGDEDS